MLYDDYGEGNEDNDYEKIMDFGIYWIKVKDFENVEEFRIVKWRENLGILNKIWY